VEDVEKGIGSLMTKFLRECPKNFAESAMDDITFAFTPPPSPPTEATPAPKDTAPSVTGGPTAAVTPPASAPNAAPPPPAPDPKLVAEVQELLESITANKESEKKFNKAVRGVFLKVFTNELYDSAHNFELLKDYTRQQMSETLLLDENVKKAADGNVPQAPKEKTEFENALKKSLDKALQAGLEKLRTKLTEVKDQWVKTQGALEIKQRHKDYLKGRLEPCDFGTCGFKFDYMLAETTRANMESFVAKLAGRDWNSLFPEDAPLPPPKSVKKATSKVAASQGKTPTVAVGTSDQ
jgi:hypothetical protein